MADPWFATKLAKLMGELEFARGRLEAARNATELIDPAKKAQWIRNAQAEIQRVRQAISALQAGAGATGTAAAEGTAGAAARQGATQAIKRGGQQAVTQAVAQGGRQAVAQGGRQAAVAAANTARAAGWGSRLAALGRGLVTVLWPPKPIPLIVAGIVIGVVVGGVVYLNSDDKKGGDGAQVAAAQEGRGGEEGYIGPAPENSCYRRVGNEFALTYTGDNSGWRSGAFVEPPADASDAEFAAWKGRVQAEVDRAFTEMRRQCSDEPDPDCPTQGEATSEEDGGGGDGDAQVNCGEEQVSETETECPDENVSRPTVRTLARAGGADPCDDETPEEEQTECGGSDDGNVCGQFTNVGELFGDLGGEVSVNEVNLYFPPGGGPLEGDATIDFGSFKLGEFYYLIGQSVGEIVEDLAQCGLLIAPNPDCGEDDGEPDEPPEIPPEYASCLARWEFSFTFEGDTADGQGGSGTAELTMVIEDLRNCPADVLEDSGEGGIEPQILTFEATFEDGGGSGFLVFGEGDFAEGATLTFEFDE
ncbi:MAG: hypothetical protein WEB00_10115 [Dehalococcoidia bacterium]